MCPCKTYNCHGGFQETCGFSEGFCDMLSKPAEYQVNWVRVYQDKNDPKQKVGCSTKERPTRKFIEAHKKKYMQAGDVSFYFFGFDALLYYSLSQLIILLLSDSTIETYPKRWRYMLTHSINERYTTRIMWWQN